MYDLQVKTLPFKSEVSIGIWANSNLYHPGGSQGKNSAAAPTF